MWALFALSRYPSGVLAERFGSRTVIVVALAATSGASALLVVAPTFPLFAAALLLLGASAGLYVLVGTGFVTDQFADRTEQALGIHSNGALAGFLVTIAAIFVANRYAWRHSLTVATLLVLFVFVVFPTLTRPDSPGKPGRGLGETLHPRRPLRILCTWDCSSLAASSLRSHSKRSSPFSLVSLLTSAAFGGACSHTVLARLRSQRRCHAGCRASR